MYFSSLFPKPMNFSVMPASTLTLVGIEPILSPEAVGKNYMVLFIYLHPICSVLLTRPSDEQFSAINSSYLIIHIVIETNIIYTLGMSGAI